LARPKRGRQAVDGPLPLALHLPRVPPDSRPLRPSRRPFVASPDFLLDYLPIIVFFGIALFFAAAFLVLPLVIAPSAPDPEKVSAYECGFNAFDDARMKFDVQFYIVAILFIIVDLDVAFLFPWAVTLFNPTLGLDRDFQIFSFWSMFIFLAVFTIGFIYEWKKGALEWR
jgi:NADH-quinone oxidoreductase subunit A